MPHSFWSLTSCGDNVFHCLLKIPFYFNYHKLTCHGFIRASNILSEFQAVVIILCCRSVGPTVGCREPLPRALEPCDVTSVVSLTPLLSDRTEYLGHILCTSCSRPAICRLFKNPWSLSAGSALRNHSLGAECVHHSRGHRSLAFSVDRARKQSCTLKVKPSPEFIWILLIQIRCDRFFF